MYEQRPTEAVSSFGEKELKTEVQSEGKDTHAGKNYRVAYRYRTVSTSEKERKRRIADPIYASQYVMNVFA